MALGLLSMKSLPHRPAATASRQGALRLCVSPAATTHRAQLVMPKWRAPSHTNWEYRTRLSSNLLRFENATTSSIPDGSVLTPSHFALAVAINCKGELTSFTTVSRAMYCLPGYSRISIELDSSNKAGSNSSQMSYSQTSMGEQVTTRGRYRRCSLQSQ